MVVDKILNINYFILITPLGVFFYTNKNILFKYLLQCLIESKPVNSFYILLCCASLNNLVEYHEFIQFLHFFM